MQQKRATRTVLFAATPVSCAQKKLRTQAPGARVKFFFFKIHWMGMIDVFEVFLG